MCSIRRTANLLMNRAFNALLPNGKAKSPNQALVSLRSSRWNLSRLNFGQPESRPRHRVPHRSGRLPPAPAPHPAWAWRAPSNAPILPLETPQDAMLHGVHELAQNTLRRFWVRVAAFHRSQRAGDLAGCRDQPGLRRRGKCRSHLQNDFISTAYTPVSLTGLQCSIHLVAGTSTRR